MLPPPWPARLALLGALLAAGPPAPARTSPKLPAAGEMQDLAGLPDRLTEGFVARGPTERDGSPDVVSGAWRRYAGPGAMATVFLVQRRPDPASGAGDRVRRELDASTASMVAVARAADRTGAPIRVVGVSADGPVAVRCHVAAPGVEQPARADAVCVAPHGPRLLKVRLTMQDQPGLATMAGLAALGLTSRVAESLPGP